jgi:hypothetical protein
MLVEVLGISASSSENVYIYIYIYIYIYDFTWLKNAVHSGVEIIIEMMKTFQVNVNGEIQSFKVDRH